MSLIRSLLLLSLCLGSAAHAVPVGTTFTYQGKLEDNNAPANGLYDFEFRLFDALTDGGQFGPVLLANDIPVENGVFSVPLNFGAFGSEARWLAISVRDGASVGVYEALSPRQAITAAPVAQFALSGNPGPQGPSGVVQIAPVAGTIGAVPFTASGPAPWLWAGPTTTVTVSAGQRITGSGSATFVNPSASAVTVSIALCISADTAGATLEALHAALFPDGSAAPNSLKSQFSANGSRIVSQAGTYRLGFCIKNKSTNVNLTPNDVVNAWFMVTN